jgi:hypothetical protein
VNEKAHVWVDRREITFRADEDFDRIAFAIHALRKVARANLKVAICEGLSTVRFDRGRDYREGPDQFWGLLSIPPHASKVEIAMAVASLTGHAQAPIVLEMLLRAGEDFS